MVNNANANAVNGQIAGAAGGGQNAAGAQLVVAPGGAGAQLGVAPGGGAQPAVFQPVAFNGSRHLLVGFLVFNCFLSTINLK